MSRLGEIWVALGANVDGLKKGMDEAQGIVQGAFKAISSMQAELASIAVVALPVGMAKSWGTAVNDLVDKTDMAGESASKLLAIGEYVGLAATDMSDALMKMSKTAFEATIAIDSATLAGEKSDDVYTQFGIAIRDTNGQLLSSEQIFKNVVGVHREMANGLEKTAMEMKIFGRSGAKLNDLLNLTDGEMSKVTEAARKSGLIISTETSQAWEDLDKKMNLSKTQMKGIAVTIGNEMMPAVDSIVTGLGELVDKYSELDSETKKNTTTALELVAAISAIRIAGIGLMAVFSPMAKLAGAAISATSAVATAAAAVVYKGYKDSQHSDNGGEFEYDDLGNVRRVDGSTAIEEDQGRKDTMELTKDWGKMDGGKGNSKDYRAPAATKAGGGSVSNNAKEISKISEELGKAKEKTQELGIAYTKMQQDIAYVGISGGAQVYAGIARERDARIQSLDDHLKRVKSSVEEAERIRLKAQETGNAEAIRKAQEYLDAEIKMQKEAAASVANEKKIIDKQTQDELLKNSTAKSAMEQQLQTAMREADYNEYLKYLELYRSADAQLFLEKQAALEYQHKWQMESMESQSTKMLEMADTFKNGFAQAIGQSIIGATKFGDAIKNLGKQMVAMWVTWMVQRAIAGAFAQGQDKKALQAQVTFGKTALAALAPAAAAKLVLDPSAAGIAAGAFAALVGGMTAMGSLAGSTGITGNANNQLGGDALSSGREGLSANAGNLGNFDLQKLGNMQSSLFKPSGMQFAATGGITTGAAIAMIGEGKYDEAVLPLNEGVFKGLFGWLDDDKGGGNTTATLVNYGDINSGHDLMDMLEEFNSVVWAGVRNH